MRAVLPLTPEDFPPHIQDLAVAHVSRFVVRKAEFADELTISSLRHTSAGHAVTAAEVRTAGGIVSTRRSPRTRRGGCYSTGARVGDWDLRDDAPTTWIWEGVVPYLTRA